MLELGRCPSWANPTQSNQIRDQEGVVSRSWNCHKLPRNHPNKKKKGRNISLFLSLTHFYYSLEKERPRKLREENFSTKEGERFLCCETKWVSILVWFHSWLRAKNWTVKQLFLNLGHLKKAIWSFHTIIIINNISIIINIKSINFTIHIFIKNSLLKYIIN